MTHTHSEYLHMLRALAGGVLMTGAVLIGSTVSTVLTGQVTGQGTMVIDHSITAHEAAIDMPSMHSGIIVLFDQHPEIRAQLVVGMLLILLGFTLYTMWIVRMRPIRATQRKSPRRARAHSL